MSSKDLEILVAKELLKIVAKHNGSKLYLSEAFFKSDGKTWIKRARKIIKLVESNEQKNL